MSRPEPLPIRRRDWIVVLGALVATLVSLIGLLRIRPSETPTVEQVLPPEVLSEARRTDRAFGDAGDFVVVVLRHRDAEQAEAGLRRTEAAVAQLEGVSRTWSIQTRPRLGLEGSALHLRQGGDGSSQLDRFLRPTPTTHLVLAALTPATTTLTGARRFSSALGEVLAHERLNGASAHATGSPLLRVATWDAARGDAVRIMPVLVTVSLAVPWLFFRTLAAALLPLVLGALSTALTFALHRAFVGAMSPWLLVLLPIVWSVATMDAMHLFERARAHVGRGAAPSPSEVGAALASSRRELLLPCGLTALTTAASLAAIAAPGGPALFRSVGVWGAVGALIAYALTFTLGGSLLRLLGVGSAGPAALTGGARFLASVSARHPRRTLGIWGLLALGALLAAFQLRIQSLYPHVFSSSDTTGSREELAAITEATGSDLVPLDIQLEATTERGRSPTRLLMATVSLHQYLHSLPETRLVLSAGTLVAEWLATDPDASRRLAQSSVTSSELMGKAEVLSDPRVAAWLRPDLGAARTLVLMSPMSHQRRSEVFAWVEHFGQTMLEQHRLRLGGPAFLYHAAEREGVRGVEQSIALELVLLTLTFALTLRSARMVGIAVVVNLTPVAVLIGAMAALKIPWSLGLLGVPVIVLGLAIDDTVHLTWQLRGGAVSARGAGVLQALRRHAGAVLSTAALLAGSLGSLALSGFRVNQQLGLLLPLGLALAVAAELTLLPALAQLRIRKRRSARPSP